MKIVVLLFLFFGVFASSNTDFPKEEPIFPSLQDSNMESKNEFSFEMGRSPLDNVSGFQYFGVILVLLGLLAFLWYVKNRLNSPKTKAYINPLMFFSKDTKESDKQIEIQSVTTLGAQSKLVIFEAYNKRYLVILNSNDVVLIDSYEINAFKDMLDRDN